MDAFAHILLACKHLFAQTVSFLWYQIFWSKVKIWKVNCAWATSFIFDKRVFLWKCQSFETENVSTWGGLEPPTFGFMPNALTYWVIRARHLLSHVFEHRLWRYRYFLNKVKIWNVFCAQATAFIFDTRTGVLVKVSTFLRQKIPRPEGDSNSQSWDSCRMLWPIELSGPGNCCYTFLNTDSGENFPELHTKAVLKLANSITSQATALAIIVPKDFTRTCWPFWMTLFDRYATSLCDTIMFLAICRHNDVQVQRNIWNWHLKGSPIYI